MYLDLFDGILAVLYCTLFRGKNCVHDILFDFFLNLAFFETREINVCRMSQKQQL